MTAIIYNTSILVGLALIGAGVAMVSIPAALATVGALVLGLTLSAARMIRKG